MHRINQKKAEMLTDTVQSSGRRLDAEMLSVVPMRSLMVPLSLLRVCAASIRNGSLQHTC